jgi:tetratricopeptide (TPR) repeat protein
MSSELKAESLLEIGHVLMMDVVGYSKLLIDDQREIFRELNAIVRGTEQFRAGEVAGKLIRLPTGDGMVLVFLTTPEAPVRCAMEIARSLREHPRIQLRMGIHSGPVGSVTDVNDRSNLAGAGINMTQRIMDSGDAGHILLSQRIAEDLGHYREWQPLLHDLGEFEVKHGARIRIYNLYNEALGNSKPPKRSTKPSSQLITQLGQRGKLRQVRAFAALIIVVGVVIWQIRAQREMKAEMAMLRKGIMEFPQMEAQVRGSRMGNDPAAVQEQIYAELGQQLGVDPKVLREKLPRFADELRKAPNTSMYERANASYVAKDYVEAERLALQAAADAQKAEPINSKNALAALELAGLSAYRAIQYARAMQHFREAEKLTDRNRNSEEWVTLQHDIADLLVAQGKYNDAEKLFRSVIEARARVLGPEHPDTLDSRHCLIYALARQSKYSEAEAEARQVLKLREKVLGPEHVDTLVSRYNLAEPLVEQGKYAEAEALYRNVIRLDEKVLGPEHPRTLAARVGLATVLGSEGKSVEAETLYREVIRLDEKLYGSEHPNTLNDRQNLATTLHADGKYAEAEEQYRDVIRIDQKLIGSEHPDTLICRNNLAELLDDEGKYSEAEAECRQIIDAETRVAGAENQLTLNTRGNLAVALIAQGKFPEAEVEYKDVMARMERVLGLEHPGTLDYATKFTRALARENKIEEARQLAKRLEGHAREALGPANGSVQRYASLVQSLGTDK